MTNPLLAFAARRRMRSARTAIIITLYSLLLFGFVYVQSMGPLMASSVSIYQMRTSVEGYIYLVAMEFLLIVLVAPAMTAGSIAGERERQTLELLLVTNTGSFRIAMGKLLESFAFICLLVLSSLPTICVVLVPGGVSAAEIGLSLLFLIVTAFASMSVGLFCSALFKRTVTATVTSYLTVFGIGVITLVPLLTGGRFDYLSPDALRKLVGSADTLTLSQTLTTLPVSFFINPVLGLLSLAAGQTGILENTLSRFGGYGITQILPYVDANVIVYVNMAFMAAAGLVLAFSSALLIRPRVKVRVAAKKRG